MNDADDFDVSFGHAIEDEVIALDELADARRDVVTRDAGMGMIRQYPWPTVECVEKVIRRPWTAFADIESDIDEILFRRT